ncbi:MAG TPA: AMP-binding protein [Burkholderiales bacterium]|nr:AMP-binding protein [Burkholderiales bacterium]
MGRLLVKKIWLASYPPGMPAEIDSRRCASIPDLLKDACSRFTDRPAYTNMGVTIRYRDLDRLSRHFAAYLQHDIGLSKGDRVAIMLPNLFQYPVALFGALRAGMVVVNINPLYTTSELEQQLYDSGASAIVVLEHFAHTLQQALPGTAVKHVITTQVGDLFPAAKRWLVNLIARHTKRVPEWHIPNASSFRRALAQGESRVLHEIAIGPEDVAFLQYTGGTTGHPKGVILTHGNLIANVEQTAVWVGVALKEREETVVTALPLYHIFALTANLLLFVKFGGNNLLITDPRDLPRFIAELKNNRYTAITGVNTLFKALLDAPGFSEAAAANRGVLKLAVAGGMSLQRSVAERWQQVTGVPLIEGYGLTEASPIVCANRFDLRGYTGKIGVPVPSTEVAILDDHGTELPLGEVGEIGVRGPQVMRGYWSASDETQKAFTADGWLLTGDIGRMDERGYVEFIERKKDVIVVSGFKAYPAEIEEVAMQHPGVKDAAVVGLPDEHIGEAVALFIVRRDRTLSAEAVLRHCSKHLTRYKLPRRIEFREQLPKTALGKTRRRLLRDEILSDVEVLAAARE